MTKKDLTKILDETRFYPSPHNSQPIRVKILSENKLEVYYDLHRGLPAESFGVQFGYVCTGVFLASLKTVAAHYGYDAKATLELSEMDFGGQKEFHKMGQIEFIERPPSPNDEELYRCFLKRQTSRIPYNNKLIDEKAIGEASAIASSYGQKLNVASDQTLVDKIIRVNQKTLFYDLENDAVHNELMTWLRFSEKEAKTKRDGLSAKTMLIPGPVLHFAIAHRSLWHVPIIGSIIKTIYLNTMRGVRQIAWLTGPFKSYEDFVKAGECFMNVWLTLTKYNVYLHPYGTVITNPRSHKEFVELAKVEENETTMAWMLFRLGYSKKPPVSYRRDLSAMIIKDEK